jgi:choice-of-anchor B domain-containing protein
MPAPWRRVCLSVCAALLAAACGGGGGGDDDDDAPESPPVADFGAELVSRVERSGVAGTWGYVAPDGSRYALMGTARGVLVLDLRDPAAPRVVDEIDGPTNTSTAGIYWREMRVYGSHAYVVSEQTNVRGGIMVLDLSGLPNSVRFVRSVTPRDGQLAAHTLDIDTTRGLLYLQRVTDLAAPAASNNDRAAALHHPVGGPDDGSVEVYDLTADPDNPRYVTTFNQHRSVHDMTAAGDHVYIAEGNAASFSKWDVSDLRAPRLVTRWNVGGFAHNIWPNADGSLVVTTEEYPLGRPARVWRMNAGAAPTAVASLQVGNATPHNVVIEGTRAYLSHYTEGFAVFDLTDPAAPQLVAHLDTNPVRGAELDGCWGVYKFPGEPYAVCSDMRTGFNLIRITR